MEIESIEGVWSINFIFFIDLPGYIESYSIQIALSSLHLLRKPLQTTILLLTTQHSSPIFFPLG